MEDSVDSVAVVGIRIIIPVLFDCFRYCWIASVIVVLVLLLFLLTLDALRWGCLCGAAPCAHDQRCRRFRQAFGNSL
jgi:hypothetical protein